MKLCACALVFVFHLHSLYGSSLDGDLVLGAGIDTFKMETASQQEEDDEEWNVCVFRGTDTYSPPSSHVHTFTHIYIHTYILTRTRTHTYIHTHTHTHTHPRT